MGNVFLEPKQHRVNLLRLFVFFWFRWILRLSVSTINCKNIPQVNVHGKKGRYELLRHGPVRNHNTRPRSKSLYIFGPDSGTTPPSPTVDLKVMVVQRRNYPRPTWGTDCDTGRHERRKRTRDRGLTWGMQTMVRDCE